MLERCLPHIQEGPSAFFPFFFYSQPSSLSTDPFILSSTLNLHDVHTQIKTGESTSEGWTKALIKRCFWRSQTVIRWHSSGIVYQVQMHRLNAGRGKGAKEGGRVDEGEEERQAMLPCCMCRESKRARKMMLHADSRSSCSTDKNGGAQCGATRLLRQRTARHTALQHHHHHHHLFRWSHQLWQTKFVRGCLEFHLLFCGIGLKLAGFNIRYGSFRFYLHNNSWAQSLWRKRSHGRRDKVQIGPIITAKLYQSPPACFDPSWFSLAQMAKAFNL